MFLTFCLPALWLIGFPAVLDETAAPSPEITAAEIEAHVRFLAADELDGRMTATRGEQRAAEYIARAFAELGLEPAGDEGSYLQKVPLERVRVTGFPELEAVTRGDSKLPLEYRRDFDLLSMEVSTEPLRVVTVRSAEQIPEPDPGLALFCDGPWSRTRKWFSEPGSGLGFGLLIRPGSKERREAKTSRLGRERLRPVQAQKEVWMRVHGPLLTHFREGDIGTVQLRARAERETVEAHNVVAYVPPEEAVPGQPPSVLVLSAHFDHIDPDGQHEADEGEDRIYNGADDNASGTAAVIELAGALAADPPQRVGVVLLLATGEELGLLGTFHYIAHPAVPLERTLYNLNIEMIGRPDELVGGAGKLWMVGWDLTNVGPALKQAGLNIAPDPRPEENFFLRSDNVAFCRQGIVGQSISSYNLHQDYHRPSDEADTLDYEHMQSATREAYRLLRLVCDGKLSPAWKEGVELPFRRR